MKPINPTPNTATAKEFPEKGKIVYDVFDEGLRFIIMRGPYHWCGYVGVPMEHPLAGFYYDDIQFISVHGGWTFSSEGENKWPAGYWWYGWDYGHSGDYSHYDRFPEKREREKKIGR